MMKNIRMGVAIVALSTGVSAQGFSEGSEAKTWNLYAEVPATFEATVVDLLCELSPRTGPRGHDGSTPGADPR